MKNSGVIAVFTYSSSTPPLTTTVPELGKSLWKAKPASRSTTGCPMSVGSRVSPVSVYQPLTTGPPLLMSTPTISPGTSTVSSAVEASTWVGRISLSTESSIQAACSMPAAAAARSPMATELSVASSKRTSYIFSRSMLATFESRLQLAVLVRPAYAPVPIPMTSAIAITFTQYLRRSRHDQRRMRSQSFMSSPMQF